jgi:phosphoenolpyruvate-protein phosphotransferase
VGEVPVAVDGDAGVVILRPDERDAAIQQERARAGSAAAATARALRGRPGSTRDGHQVPLLANIGRPEDAGPAIAAGAEGVGLFRTEFVFMGRSAAPTEDEQVRAYTEVLEQFGRDRPVVIRLADIGGDKAIPYLGLPAEANPFLGVRGLRLAYDVARPLLVTQIRAIARAGAASGTVPHLMAPMVATLEDVELLLELRAEAFAALDREGTVRAERIVTGIMVEVPSAALIADRLAPHVDFFSIGSNDLTQYTLAADRTNGKLGSLQDALHPAVLAAIALTVSGADGAGIPVAVCGELASDPAGALVLVGLGVDELSMEAKALDAIRLRLSEHPHSELEGLALEALAAPSAAAVRDLVAARFGG